MKDDVDDDVDGAVVALLVVVLTVVTRVLRIRHANYRDDDNDGEQLRETITTRSRTAPCLLFAKQYPFLTFGAALRMRSNNEHDDGVPINGSDDDGHSDKKRQGQRHQSVDGGESHNADSSLVRQDSDCVVDVLRT